LREVLEKTEENNELLRKIHRASVWGRAFKIFYWFIIIGATLSSYYFIQPYVGSLLGAYKSIISGAETLRGTADTIQNTGSQLPDVSELLKKYGR